MKTALANALQARWNMLLEREKMLLRGASIFLGLVLLGWWGVATPLATLHQAEAQRLGLDAQWQQMQALQVEAQALQGQAKLSAEDAARALQASVRQRLGASAQLHILGSRATVTLRGAPADALAAWLTEARANAHAVPSEARMVRSASGAAGIATWDGTLALDLPVP